MAESGSSSTRLDRMIGVVGIGFVVTLLGQFLLAPKPPAFDAAGPEIRDYLIDNRSGLLAAGVMQLLAVVFLTGLAIGLSRVLRRAGHGAMLAAAAVAGAVLMTAVVLVAQAAYDATVWIDGLAADMSDDLLRYVWSLTYVAFGSLGPGALLLTGSVAVAGFKGGVVPRWVAWVSAVVAVASLVSFLAVADSGLGFLAFFPYLGMALFGLVVSIGFLRGSIATGTD